MCASVTPPVFLFVVDSAKSATANVDTKHGRSLSSQNEIFGRYKRLVFHYKHATQTRENFRHYLRILSEQPCMIANQAGNQETVVDSLFVPIVALLKVRKLWTYTKTQFKQKPAESKPKSFFFFLFCTLACLCPARNTSRCHGKFRICYQVIELFECE